MTIINSGKYSPEEGWEGKIGVLGAWTPRSVAVKTPEVGQIPRSRAIARDDCKGQDLGGRGYSGKAEGSPCFPGCLSQFRQPSAAGTLLQLHFCILPGPPLEITRFRRLLPAVLSSTFFHWLQQEKEELGVKQQRG